MITMILASLLLFANVDNQKIDVAYEIVVLIDSTRTQIDKDEFKKEITTATNRLPDTYRMGENYSRIAVVLFHFNVSVLLNLTSDENLVRNLTDADITSHQGEYERQAEALDKATELFADARPRVQKFIIMITNGDTRDHDEAVKKADELRKNGVFFYIAFVGEPEAMKDNEKKLKQLAGNSSFMRNLSDIDQIGASAVVQSQGKKTECEKFQLNQTCRYDDPSRIECSQIWWPENVELKKCDIYELSCQRRDCDAVCDRLWPWRNCTVDECGKNVTVDRRDPMPREVVSIVKNCLQKKSIACAECRIDSSSKESTSTSSSSRIDSSPKESSSSSSQLKSISAGIDSSPIISSQSSQSDSSTSAVPKVADKKTDGQSTEPSKSLQPWAIVLIVIGVMVFLALIVAAVLPAVRKRRLKKEAENKKRSDQNVESAIDRGKGKELIDQKEKKSIDQKEKKSIDQKSKSAIDQKEKKSIGQKSQSSIDRSKKKSMEKIDQPESVEESRRDDVAVGESAIAADRSIGVSLVDGSGRSITQSMPQTKSLNQEDQSIVRKQIKEIQRLVKDDDLK